MFYCPNCGVKLADDSKFCSYCGTRIQPEKKENADSPMFLEESLKKRTEYTSSVSGENSKNKQEITEDPKHQTKKTKSAAGKKKNKTTRKKKNGWGPVLVVLFLLLLIAAGGETSDEETPESGSSMAASSYVEAVVSSDISDSIDDAVSSTASSAAGSGSTAVSGENHDSRPERNEFDSASNGVYEFARYYIEIPAYWAFETEIDEGIRRYAESGGKVAMFQITAGEDPDVDYPVTFDGLMDDNDNMIAMLEKTTFKEVTGYEVIDTGTVKGILYKGTIEESGVTGYGEWFAFPSETDRNWCNLVLMQSDNTEYSYTEDFMKMIHSIQPIEETNNGKEGSENKSVQNLTKENCSDLAALLALRDPVDPSVPIFANKYKGQVIEFDGCVTNMAHHGNYKTRWDVLLGAGDFDENHAWGPNFRLTDVNFYDMNVTGGDSVYAGLNVHVVAEVGEYNPISGLFELEIISMQIRN